jgi:flagellar hook-associated protein 3 FlgL
MLQVELNKVSKQISTGNQITSGYEDTTIFKKTIDLDTDINLTSQLQESAESAKAFAEYTDTTLDSMTTAMEQVKVKLLAYGGSVHSKTSREALVNELKSLKDSMIHLSNTQVNGEYLFGGTDNKTPPIDVKGNYQGNSEKMTIRTDRFQSQEYSIDGASLFLGYDMDIKSRVTTNIQKLDQSALKEIPPREVFINGENSILDLTGTEKETTFYMSGTRPDGTGFKHKFTVSDPSSLKVEDLAEEIKLVFHDEVSIEISKGGQFIIEDKESGNSKLNFHMVASTANVDNLADLEGKETFEFVKSADLKSTVSEEMNFKKKGNLLSNNIQQFLSVAEGFASKSNKLSEVSGADLTNTTLNIGGKNIRGENIEATLTFGEEGTTVNINGSSYELQNGGADFTYKQLTEVMNVALSGVENGDFSTAVLEAEKFVDVEMNHRGEFQIRDLTSSNSKMEFSMFDASLKDFSSEKGSAISFNSNKAIDLDRPSVDIFEAIDFAIEAVEEELFHPDGNRVGFEGNRGVSGSIDNITHLIDHVIKSRAESGSQLQNIQYTLDRSEALKTNMKITKNDVISVDFAELSSYFSALSLNYQAMLQSVAKVQNMSLVNYI